jgi:hypothetical protein
MCSFVSSLTVVNVVVVVVVVVAFAIHSDGCVELVFDDGLRNPVARCGTRAGVVRCQCASALKGDFAHVLKREFALLDAWQRCMDHFAKRRQRRRWHLADVLRDVNCDAVGCRSVDSCSNVRLPAVNSATARTGELYGL